MRNLTISFLTLLLVQYSACQGCSEDLPRANDAGLSDVSVNTEDASANTPDVNTNESDAAANAPDVIAQTPQVVLAFGEDMPSGAKTRVQNWITQSAEREVVLYENANFPLAEGSMLFAFGNHDAAFELISQSELDDEVAETVIIRSRFANGISHVAGIGKPMEIVPIDSGAANVNISSAVAAYDILERFGFGFLHPLEPFAPPSLLQRAPDFDEKLSPLWPVRGLQIHTMHPLELTNMWQGWGETSPDDEEGFNAMLPEWERYLEWSVANGQNHVHTVTLIAESWAAFGDSPERIERFRTLVDMAHNFGVLVGVDVPIALHQQHAWRLIRDFGDLDDEKQQLRDRIDYLMNAGFDYFATESGSSEFTSPDGDTMLQWMDELARHLETEYGRRAFIKVHISSGQTVENYADPDTGEPINFNYLPHYALPSLGVMPHTVQHYALDDRAPTYGNDGFSDMRRFLQMQAGSRETLWHPETAYWVSFDIDLPLFLPVYAKLRFHDLRLLKSDEDQGLMGRGANAGARMDGQITFSSGWEWGYWLNDVITARATWNLYEDLEESEAYRQILIDALKPLGTGHVELAHAIADLSDEQDRLIVDGDFGSGPPADIERRSGQAYLQGWESWDDVADASENIPGVPHIGTQPQKLGLVEMRNPLHAPPNYTDEVKPLLNAMEITFGERATQLEAMAEGAHPYFNELAQSTRMLALRSKQVHGLYDYVDNFFDLDQSFRQARLAEAQNALDEAQEIVNARELEYRVNQERIAGWYENPTAYSYGYLWTVRTLHFWWRDERKAIEAPNSPCFMNVINGIDVGFGEGPTADFGDLTAQITSNVWGISGLTSCLGVPESEPEYPLDHWRE